MHDSYERQFLPKKGDQWDSHTFGRVLVTSVLPRIGVLTFKRLRGRTKYVRYIRAFERNFKFLRPGALILLALFLSACGTQLGQALWDAGAAPAKPAHTVTIVTPKGRVTQYTCRQTATGAVCYQSVKTGK